MSLCNGGRGLSGWYYNWTNKSVSKAAGTDENILNLNFTYSFFKKKNFVESQININSHKGAYIQRTYNWRYIVFFKGDGPITGGGGGGGWGAYRWGAYKWKTITATFQVLRIQCKLCKKIRQKSKADFTVGNILSFNQYFGRHDC